MPMVPKGAYVYGDEVRFLTFFPHKEAEFILLVVNIQIELPL